MMKSIITICAMSVVAGVRGAPWPRPTLQASLPGGKERVALYDTGAAVSMIDEYEFRNIPICFRPEKESFMPILNLEGADKQKMSVKGCYSLEIQVLGRKVKHFFYVVRNLSSPIIFGIDFINTHALAYNPISRDLMFIKDWETAAASVSHRTVIEANSSRSIELKTLVCPLDGRKIVGPLTAVCKVDCTESPIFGKDALINIDKYGNTRTIIDNPLDIPVTLERGTYIGSIERVNLAECSVVQFDMTSQPLEKGPLSESTSLSKEKRELLTSSINEQLAYESKEVREKYLELILKNHDIFSEDKYDLGRTHIMSHKVTLKDKEPIYVKQFRIPESHRSVLLDHLQNWIKLGVVSPSRSSYNSPIFCVPKKDGSLRPVLDFRAVNDSSFTDKYSQNEIQDCIDALGRSKSKVFSSLDLTCGFWQLPLDEKSREYTAFTIPGVGSFHWNMTPMGLRGSPASFGRLMDFVMRNLPSCITYQDDVLIHARNHAEQYVELQKAFDRVRAHGLKLNVKKCQFGQREVSYLGFLLTPDGILPGLDKTKAIRDFEPPKNIRQVREFIGLCNYFRNSIKNFSAIASELTKLTRKDSEWKGGELPPVALEAFYKLQKALLSAPVLAYPDPNKPYHLMVDAAVGSDTEDKPGGVGASLIQFDENENPHPIGFVSRSLTSYEKNYTAYLLELAACVYGIEKFHVYLTGKPFTLYTDHRPLEPLKKVHTRTLNRLQQLMLEYDFTIQYKPGVENTVPDFLSRNPISAVDMKYDTLIKLQGEDPLINSLMKDYRADSQDPKFMRIKQFLLIQNNILFHLSRDGKYRIFAPAAIQSDILKSAHNSYVGGHMGIFKTTQRIINTYYWPNMHKDIEEHVKSCVDCQRTKPHSKHPRPPLRPLEQPHTPNHRIHIDLFGPLSTSESGKKYILVITDAFSKYVELVAVASKEAKCIADALMDTWFTRYSTPHEVLSDNGGEFCNKLAEELYDRLKIMHKTTSPYHPECNASAETFNRTMRQYIQAVIKPPYLDWEIYLPALRIAYNTSISKATKKSPFSLVFGMEPHMPFFEFEPEINYNDDYNDRLVALEKARREAIENNLIYKEMYAAQYNARHKVKDPSLAVGDLILVENRAQQCFKNKKLQPLYEGPFTIVRISIPNVYYQRNRKTKVTHINRIKKIQSSVNVNEDSNIVHKVPSQDKSQELRSVEPKTLRLPRQAKKRFQRLDQPKLIRTERGREKEAVHVWHEFDSRSEASLDESSAEEIALSLDEEALLDESAILAEFPQDEDSEVQIDNTESDFVIVEEEEQNTADRSSRPPMDTGEISHFYANDLSLRSLHSQPLEEAEKTKDRVYTKRSLASLSTSPPIESVAKRTPALGPQPQVRQSLADICLKPFKIHTRSKGPVAEVPYNPFPVGTRAYSRELERQAEPSQEPAPPPTIEDGKDGEATTSDAQDQHDVPIP